MKYWRLIPVIVMSLIFSLSCEAQEEKSLGEKRAERLQAMEDAFWAAQKAGETVKGVIVEGNSFFNGTTEPQNRAYGQPYTEEELLAAKISAERNSKLFILTQDGTLYYPTVEKGRAISGSTANERIERVLSDEQKAGEKLFTWATLVPMVGREVEVHGDIYPGYAGVKSIYIKSIYFEGLYLVGQE